MKTLWRIAYSFVAIPLFWAVIRVLGIVNRKVRRGISGRARLLDDVSAQVARMPSGKRVWFHSSSMGEFEQAKPIILALKHKHPDVRVVVTFFSPSGYEHSKKYSLADVITYIPFDTARSARKFLSIVRPTVAVMVRYDIWPNHIWELERQGIPVLLANATMRRHTSRRLPLIRNFHHHVYRAFAEILTVSPDDAEMFTSFSLNCDAIHAIGDTRYDQVVARSLDAKKRRILPENITQGKSVIVAGSTWPEDEEVILPALFSLNEATDKLLFILVPHEPTVEHVEDLEQQLEGRVSAIRYSALNEYRGERVIIVDSIGILLILYAYADIAYIGGSFRQGIHNVLEAAVFGIPVVFGPRHRNSQEPLQLVERGGGFVVNTSEELFRTFNSLLENAPARATAGSRAAEFVRSNTGATDRFLQHLECQLTK